jgi:hydroxymethylbilane synthase
VKLVLGTRGSALALWQARWVEARLRAAHATLEVEVRVIHTSGDRIGGPLAAAGGKGLFIKEIEEALATGAIDLAVHSMKDVPAALAPGLCVAAVPEREDARDALVSRDRIRLSDLGPGARLGTGSLRRVCQIRKRHPALQVIPLRGNVDTRLRKMRAGEVDAIVLALAGLRRLGLEGEVAEALDPAECLPAVGQGALCLEAREDDSRTGELLRALNHGPTSTCVAAERAFLAELGGDCHVPVAAHARLRDGRLVMEGLVGRPDGSELLRDRAEGDAAEPAGVGRALAGALLGRGAARILQEIRASST